MMTAKRSTSEKPGAPSVSGIRPSIDPARLFCEALPFILTMAQGRGFDEQAQRDVAQAVGVVLVERRGNYDPDRGTPIQWAIGIARNVLRETARRQRTERRYIDAAPTEAMGHRPALDLTPEERARAQSALSLACAALTDEQLQIFELTAQEYTAQEIAAILGVTRSRVEQRIREARERLAALLKRLGEDRVSAAHVRGVVLPFVSLDELEKALRVGRVREGVAEELWGGVQDASRVSHVPISASVVGKGTRMAFSAVELGAGAVLLLLTGAGVGVGVFAAVTSEAPGEPPSIVAEAPSEVALATTSSPAATASATTDMARDVVRVPAGADRVPTATPTASTSTDAGIVDESTLLQMALGASPQRGLELANQHARRFPSQHAGKRELIIVRALVALGRRSEAEARARALKGTVYEKAITEALGGLRP